jgi:3-oxoacyl-[acyl-carrier protein] reductase
MDLGLRDRVVLVTGATGGIGRAVARAFAAEGARVAITWHSDKDGAERLAAELGADVDRAMCVNYELADDASAPAAVAAVKDRWGAIEVLVAAAARPDTDISGSGLKRVFEDIPIDHCDSVLRANVEGTLHIVQAVLGGMRRQGWGRIVLYSSYLAEIGMPGGEIYGAAKAALHGLVRSLVWQTGGSDVLVNIVVPALTVTERIVEHVPMAVRDRQVAVTPTGRLTTPEDLAALTVFLCSQANGNITGQAVRVTGGL